MTITLTVTEPVPATMTPARRSSTDLGCIAAVTPPGELRLPPVPSHPSAIAMSRCTYTGTTYRIDLGRGISCWLDGDEQDGTGELNWVATQMCTALSGATFTGPDDAPFVCGLVLFTGTDATASSHGAVVGLSDQQLRRVVDAHAAVTDEACQAAPAELSNLVAARG